LSLERDKSTILFQGANMQSKQIAVAVAAVFALAAPAFAADDLQHRQRSQDSMSNPSHDDAARSAGTSQSGMGGPTQSSDAVREVQQALQQKGHDVGPIDGVMGPKTSAALREFQQAEGLKASGRLDRQTLSALGVQADMRSSGASSREGMSANSGRRGAPGTPGASVSSDATSPSPSSTQSGKTETSGTAQGRAARTPPSTDAAPSSDAARSDTFGTSRGPAVSSDKTSPSPESTSSGATPRSGG
jgi:peptidoglycan hydrolase-like protein with peptidoglycan-binding domain